MQYMKLSETAMVVLRFTDDAQVFDGCMLRHIHKNTLHRSIIYFRGNSVCIESSNGNSGDDAW